MGKDKKILLYFVSFVLGLLTIMLIGMTDVFALTNKTIYSGVNSSGLTGSGYYNYGYINAGGVQNTTTAAVGSTINGVSYGFQFYYYEDVIINNTYTLKINFKSTDLLKNVNSNYFDIKTCTNNNCSNAIIISLEKQNQNSNSSWIIVKFNPVDRGNIVSVDIGTENNEAITGIDNFGISSIQTEYSNANQDIIDNNNNNTNNIIDNNNNNTQNIIDSNKETQEVIKDQFNTCRPSVNLINPYNSFNTSASYTYNDYTYKITSNGSIYLVVPVQVGKTYTLSYKDSVNFASIRASDYNNGGTWLEYGRSTSANGQITFTSNSNTAIIAFVNGTTNQSSVSKVQLEEGSIATTFEPYGEKICQNKLDEAENTRKGIWETIKDLPNAFMNMLKRLFIPEDDYFENWFNVIKKFFEDKLGFLATPFTIIIDFVNRYLSLNPQEDIIINIPDITVPNFENYIIIEATTFNWSELLESKESLNMLWQLYLSFVDVFLILNFINLCENKYNRIFGGDTTQYEYYTVEDSYNVDVNTGEVKSQRRNERTTTRKKVN